VHPVAVWRKSEAEMGKMLYFEIFISRHFAHIVQIHNSS